mgnify:FL=1
MCCNENCIESISIYPSSVTLRKGEWYYDIIAEIIPSSASCNVRWSSSDTSVASVNASTGYIYAQNVGSAVIYASATDGSGVSAWIPVTVISGNVVVESVELDKSSMTVEVGATAKLTAIVCPSNATNNTVIWSSSNSAIARVDSDGTIYGLKRGTAIVTATANDGSGKSDSCQIIVSGDVLITSISLNVGDDTTAEVNDQLQIRTTVYPANATERIDWNSSNTSVLTVTEYGLVTAVGPGVGFIYARAHHDETIWGSCRIVVFGEQPIKIDPDDVLLYPGESIVVDYDIEPCETPDRRIEYYSNDEALVSTSNGGYEKIKLTARENQHFKDTAIVTARMLHRNYTATCNVTVDPDKVEIRKKIDGSIVITFNTYDNERDEYQRVVWNSNDMDANNAINYNAQQLAKIYVFDPQGVKNYFIMHFPSQFKDKVIKRLELMDDTYNVLFDEPYKYFNIVDGQAQYYVSWERIRGNARYETYTTAELAFGLHTQNSLEAIGERIWDSIMDKFVELVLDATPIGVVKDLYNTCSSIKAMLEDIYYTGSLNVNFKNAVTILKNFCNIDDLEIFALPFKLFDLQAQIVQIGETIGFNRPCYVEAFDKVAKIFGSASLVNECTGETIHSTLQTILDKCNLSNN